MNAYAEFNVVHCDWCDTHTNCRSLFDGDVWVMSVCPNCDVLATYKRGDFPA